MSNRAWVTLATNDSYGLGALVLAHSLRRAGSAYPAVVLITPSVTEAMSERLRAVFAEVVVVDVLDSRDAAHLALLQRPELGITFTKIHCWNLTQYEKCVFLDADTLIVQNCDELFERDELSAAPDVGWPDCFNSGVFVFKPSAETFSNLITFASERGSFDGGDQGLLNSFFSDWAHGDINKHLPFLYNVTSAAFYSYIPALKHYGQNLKIIHFIGAAKPWLQHYNWPSRSVEAPEHIKEFLQLWWDLFVGQVHSQLDTAMDFTVHDRKYLTIPFIKSSKSIHSHINVRSDRYNMCSKQTPLESHDEEDEVLEVLPATPHEQPVDYSESAVNYSYYEPVLNPDSEFSWHHPDNQVTNLDIKVPEIDISQFHDPWNIYRGNIPPSTDESKQMEQQVDSYHDMRKYAWDYTHPQPDQCLTESQNYQQKFHYDNLHAHNPNESQRPLHNDNIWDANNDSTNKEKNNNSEAPHDCHQQHSLDDWQSQTQNQNASNHYHNNIHSPINSKHHSLQSHHEPQHPHEYHQNHFDQPQHNNFMNKTQNNESTYDHNISHPSKNDCHVANININKYHELHGNKKTQAVNYSYSQFKNQNHTEPIYTVMMDHVKLNNNISEEKVNGYGSDGDSDIYEEITPRHPYDGFYLRHRMTIDSHGRKICSHEIPLVPSLPPSESSDEFEDALESLEDVHDMLIIGEESRTGVAGNLARVVPGAPLQQEAVDELTRRQGWEAGNIDYMGADSFDNIWAKISQTLNQPLSSAAEQSEPSKEDSNLAPVEVAKEAVESISQAKAAKEDLVQKVSSEAVSAKVTTPTESAVTPTTETSASVPVPVEEPALADVPVPAREAAQASGKPEEIIPVPVEAVTVESPASITAAAATESAAAPIASSAPVESDVSVESASPVESTTQVETITSNESVTPVESSTKLESDALVESAASVEDTTPVESGGLVETTSEQSTAPVESIDLVEPAGPIESDVPAVSATSIESSASAESTAPVESTVPVETAAPVESVMPVEAAAPVESAVPVETAAPVESAVPVETAAPVESAVPVETAAAEESAIPKETDISAESAAPVKSALELEATIPVESSEEAISATTTEASGAVESAASAESTAPVESATAAESAAPAESVALAEPISTDVKEKTELAADVPVVDVEAVKIDETPTIIPQSDSVTEASPSIASTPASVPEPTPIPKPSENTLPARLADKPEPDTDSPPLANTPSKEEIPGAPAAKSEERRKPAGKLQLRPPRSADALPTPDSEVEDAAALAQAIIAGELRTPTVTAPSPPTPPAHRPTPPAADSRLSVQEPEVPTPPVGAVSLAQIGVKPKPSTATQIESSVSSKSEPPSTPETPKTADTPKKKIVKKVVKKDKEGVSSGEAPVPPPRKKEKKPKEK